MRAVVAFVFALVLASVQAALLRYLGGGAVPVAMVLPIVVYLALHAGNLDGAVGAASVGYVVDLMAGEPKGLMMFLAVALFLCSRLAASGLSVQGAVGFVLLSGVGTFLYGLAALLLTRAVSPAESAPTFSLLGRMFTEAWFTGMLSPLIFAAMRWLDGLMAREDPSLLR